jgi:hypothetical protein
MTAGASSDEADRGLLAAVVTYEDPGMAKKLAAMDPA